MTLAQEAYQDWKKRNKVDLSVKTDEQMFIIGFETRDAEVKELTELVVDLMARVNELKPKAKKVKTNADV